MISGAQVSESDIEAHETKSKIQEFRRRQAQSQSVSVYGLLCDVSVSWEWLTMIYSPQLASCRVYLALACFVTYLHAISCYWWSCVAVDDQAATTSCCYSKLPNYAHPWAGGTPTLRLKKVLHIHKILYARDIESLTEVWSVPETWWTARIHPSKDSWILIRLTRASFKSGRRRPVVSAVVSSSWACDD